MVKHAPSSTAEWDQSVISGELCGLHNWAQVVVKPPGYDGVVLNVYRAVTDPSVGSGTAYTVWKRVK